MEATNVFSTTGRNMVPENKKLDSILNKFETVFRDNIPKGLPPVRSIDQYIQVEDGKRPSTRPLFQLSPAELLAVKDYVIDMLRKGMIRRSKSPFGASLFLVKEENKLRSIVYYHGLNIITKRNNSPIPRFDDMFDRLGEAQYV